MSRDVTEKRHYLSRWIAEHYDDIGRLNTGWKQTVPLYQSIKKIEYENVYRRFFQPSYWVVSVTPERARCFNRHFVNELTLRELCILRLRLLDDHDLPDDNYTLH